ncbi:MAG TPA: biotin carboxylase N-terminal domain-containing protein [Thermoleophilaceae bacterium]|nr:biotin carboxylase N-terminal domain-containing protein [Thermoleophilaceae bacterium]
MSQRPIAKLLVANRGEIARRVFRTCRELGIATVAVFSDPDAEAPFVREADEAVALGGPAPGESYLRAEKIVEAARRTGADAVHPGYGFLAENAGFARACADAGVTFVGPPPDAIEAMGSKIEANARMERAAVPTLPSVDVTGLDGEPLAAAADEVGWPLMTKPSAGGGGKGMRVVRSREALAGAVAGARREAAAAFGDDALMLERLLERPRHVEIQVFGDATGRVVHLFERECSIQRRHQKIVEECPSPAVDLDLRDRMGAAAVDAGEALGYVGAGTVEFLLGPHGDFYFLEMNTRLQVEHPVTELVTGLDLVALGLRVAEGAPLPPEALEPRLEGHAIEARLYAEDPERDFLPTVGHLTRFAVPGAVRVDSGVEDGSEIGVHYDPMLAKVIAHAPTREAAARRLAHALAAAELHGPRTNRDLLVRVLRHPEFLAGETDTHFLERHPPAELGAPLTDASGERLHAAAAALAGQAERRAYAPVLATVPSGYRNNPSQLQETVFEGPCGALTVGYRLGGGGRLTLRVDGSELEDPVVHAAEPGGVDLEVGGVRRRYRVARAGGTAHVDSALGHSSLRELERFPAAATEDSPGSLTSPMHGAVLRVHADAGDSVERGTVVMVLEAMKMEHEILAPATGKVAELRVGEGEQVEAGTVLAVIEEDGEG